MTAYNPPSSIYFNGIGFNPTIIETTVTGNLTIAQANGLYLQKTVDDTDPYLASFSSGIEALSINSNNNYYNTLVIGDNAVKTQNVIIGNASNLATNIDGNNLAMGTDSTNITLGNPLSSIIVRGNIQMKTLVLDRLYFNQGTLSQPFFMQTLNNYSFGAVNAFSSVTNTYTFSTLGLTDYPDSIINAMISSNSATIMFSISSYTVSSVTVTAFNPNNISVTTSSFSLLIFGN